MTTMTDPTWVELVRAIAERPDDDTPRLAAADWLDEQDGPEWQAWASFIRDRVTLARLPDRGHVYQLTCDCDGCRCERRSVATFDRWGAAWAAATWVAPLSFRTEERGFDYWLALMSALEKSATHAPA